MGFCLFKQAFPLLWIQGPRRLPKQEPIGKTGMLMVNGNCKALCRAREFYLVVCLRSSRFRY
jgi:hypothetical protein